MRHPRLVHHSWIVYVNAARRPRVTNQVPPFGKLMKFLKELLLNILNTLYISTQFLSARVYL